MRPVEVSNKDRYQTLERHLRAAAVDINNQSDVVGPDSPIQYAPPAHRDLEEPVRQVKSFGELPTHEIDKAIASADDALTQLKKEAQDVRNIYTKYTDRIAEQAKTLEETVKASLEALRDVRKHCDILQEQKSLAPLVPESEK